jgi:hypothetical protein
MATRTRSPAACEVVCEVLEDTATEELLDLLIADDEWVHSEFEALVATGWGDADPPSPPPSRGARWPRRPGFVRRPSPVRPTRGHVAPRAGTPHERGPPRR